MGKNFCMGQVTVIRKNDTFNCQHLYSDHVFHPHVSEQWHPWHGCAHVNKTHLFTLNFIGSPHHDYSILVSHITLESSAFQYGPVLLSVIGTSTVKYPRNALASSFQQLNSYGSQGYHILQGFVCSKTTQHTCCLLHATFRPPILTLSTAYPVAPSYTF